MTPAIIPALICALRDEYPYSSEVCRASTWSNRTSIGRHSCRDCTGPDCCTTRSGYVCSQDCRRDTWADRASRLSSCFRFGGSRQRRQGPSYSGNDPRSSNEDQNEKTVPKATKPPTRSRGINCNGGPLHMAHALNLVLRIKQDDLTRRRLGSLKSTFADLLQPQMDNVFRQSEVIHFARIIVIDDQYVVVIAEYDGAIAEYTEFFRRALPNVFRELFSIAEGLPDWNDLDANAFFFDICAGANVRSLGNSIDDIGLDGEPGGVPFLRLWSPVGAGAPCPSSSDIEYPNHQHAAPMSCFWQRVRVARRQAPNVRSRHLKR